MWYEVSGNFAFSLKEILSSVSSYSPHERIYIKKVQKFPEYRVPTDPKIDKKIIRMEQEKAFNMLKKNLIEAGGIVRWILHFFFFILRNNTKRAIICLVFFMSLIALLSLNDIVGFFVNKTHGSGLFYLVNVFKCWAVELMFPYREYKKYFDYLGV